MYLTGMTMGLFSKIPDPYNPKPPTTLDWIREKAVFRVSSWVQVIGAGMLAHGNYKKGDVLGTLGGATLMGSLTTRSFAPFGGREVNRDELYAHIAEGLAKVQPEKLPDAVGETAHFLEGQFRDKHLSFGSAYMQLSDAIKRYHGIALYPERGNKPTLVTADTGKFQVPAPHGDGFTTRVRRPVEAAVGRT